MGSAASSNSVRPKPFVYVQHQDQVVKVLIDKLSYCKEIEETIALAVGLDRKCEFVLRDCNGTVVTCGPSMPVNDCDYPYEMTVLKAGGSLVQSDPIGAPVVEAATLLANQLQRILNFEEFQKQTGAKLAALEKRLNRETMKFTEIAKIEANVRQLQQDYLGSKNQSPDFTRIRPSASACNSFYVPMVESHGGSLKPKRDTWWEFTKYQLSDETISYLKTPTFDIWQWDHNEMVVLIEYMYQELGIMDEMNINPSVFRRWLLVVQENYRNNPFHNFRHCFCVTQMMYGLINVCQLNAFFSVHDLAVLLTAAICHDLDHPGFNNTYQINARTELALRYNDVSPLENHHCAIAFKILSNPDLNIFANVGDSFRHIRSGIIELILATDMARHGELLDNFKKISTNFDPGNQDHLTHLKMVLIKACDISNEVRPMDVSGPWVECLLEEYFQQAERERKEGLPVAPFMDKNIVTKSSAQLGFIQYVLTPLFQPLAKLFPQLEELLVTPLLEAQQYYLDLKEKENSNFQQVKEIKLPAE